MSQCMSPRRSSSSLVLWLRQCRRSSDRNQLTWTQGKVLQQTNVKLNEHVAGSHTNHKIKPLYLKILFLHHAGQARDRQQESNLWGEIKNYIRVLIYSMWCSREPVFPISDSMNPISILIHAGGSRKDIYQLCGQTRGMQMTQQEGMRASRCSSSLLATSVKKLDNPIILLFSDRGTEHR